MANNERELYVDCIQKQLEEVQLLSSIYCNPGELQILDPSYVCDFEQFLKDEKSHPVDVLHTHLEFIVKLETTVNNAQEKMDVRIELPHLYPTLEHPVVTVQSSLLTKDWTQFFKTEIAKYIENCDKQSPYMFELLTWIKEQIQDTLKTDLGGLASNSSTAVAEAFVDFERLWIYSHHIKAKSKRQEIIKQSCELNLSGFLRPGKPGIICVEGLRKHTQEFWSIIKSLRWQKINICKNEIKQVPQSKLDKLRRFEGFKEQLFCDDKENADIVMNMGLFIKYLESHNSGYMKKELFGIE